MQIAGTTSQGAASATATPVQPMSSPTPTASQAGNIVMVIIFRTTHPLILSKYMHYAV